MYKRIVLAYDGSKSGQKALLDCQDLVQWTGADLSLVAVLPNNIGLVAIEGGVYDSGIIEQEKQAMQEVLDEGLNSLRAAGFQANGSLLTGDTVGEITSYATEIKADLIVVGHKHLEGWAARWWKTSVSEALIAHSPCSVLVAITHEGKSGHSGA